MALDELKQKVLDSITQILLGTSLSETQFFSSLLLEILNRLDSLGYKIKESDDWVISFAAQKVENTIKNECNVTKIPDGLKYVAVDMICGEVLLAKMQSGQLNNDFDLEGAIKQVQAGDTTVTYAVADGTDSSEQRFNALIAYLLNGKRGEFVSYRKIKW